MPTLILTGPESSGKTTLSQSLQTAFGALLLPEYARIYLERRPQTPYHQAEVHYMAQVQARCQRYFQYLAQKQGRILICDTDLLVFEVWCEEAYGQAPQWLRETWRRQAQNHFYLLCAPDLPHQADPLREHPNPEDRQRLFLRYQEKLEQAQCPYALVQGQGSTRCTQAQAAYSSYLAQLQR